MKFFLLLICTLFLNISTLIAQSEVYPWSNISGIRVDGELIELNSSFCIIGSDWTQVRKTAKERARYQYIREGNTQITRISVGDFHYDQSVEDIGGGNANIRINYRNEVDTSLIGTFFLLELPASKYSDATVQLIEPTPGSIKHVLPTGTFEILR